MQCRHPSIRMILGFREAIHAIVPIRPRRGWIIARFVEDTAAILLKEEENLHAVVVIVVMGRIKEADRAPSSPQVSYAACLHQELQPHRLDFEAFRVWEPVALMRNEVSNPNHIHRGSERFSLRVWDSMTYCSMNFETLNFIENLGIRRLIPPISFNSRWDFGLGAQRLHAQWILKP